MRCPVFVIENIDWVSSVPQNKQKVLVINVVKMCSWYTYTKEIVYFNAALRQLFLLYIRHNCGFVTVCMVYFVWLIFIKEIWQKYAPDIFGFNIWPVYHPCLSLLRMIDLLIFIKFNKKKSKNTKSQHCMCVMSYILPTFNTKAINHRLRAVMIWNKIVKKNNNISTIWHILLNVQITQVCFICDMLIYNIV